MQQEQQVLIDPQVMDRIQDMGRQVGAQFAYFFENEFMQYYKPGDITTNHYWLYMPILKRRPNEWRNSFHFCLERMMDFERKRGKKVALVQIRYSEQE